ncbi:MAG: tRNA (N6-threonylcarbamoyladenosine(37)-N6)-methyltransferase TrmO [Eubacteriales bacterium]|nr:tRNA (N6-threonylcarbamoyladenosine(37)-N6)-methyltransferase TrmO [Eubacteriales bacterium]
MKVIAKIKTDFPEKFGIPRQSGLANTVATVVFEPEYRVDEALRGIEGFSHLWLIWEFHRAKRDEWSPTVRPPRLGGNKRMGVFATRSPFRPNSIGLSSVKLLGTEKTSEGTVLIVSGADLLDGTPIFDIKPYLPFTDCHADAVGGFADERKDYSLEVVCDGELLSIIPSEKIEPLLEILSEDPRPQYIDDPERIYGMRYGDYEIKFSVDADILTVKNIEKV